MAARNPLSSFAVHSMQSDARDPLLAYPIHPMQSGSVRPAHLGLDIEIYCGLGPECDYRRRAAMRYGDVVDEFESLLTNFVSVASTATKVAAVDIKLAEMSAALAAVNSK